MTHSGLGSKEVASEAPPAPQKGCSVVKAAHKQESHHLANGTLTSLPKTSAAE